ncbi:MAG TPA: phosphodiester glycosidase family protein [Pyrinomonadaceae bacterium]|nr:phosphodiester glycosidase family protein [Pyrinomonadaceae bacterium]
MRTTQLSHAPNACFRRFRLGFACLLLLGLSASGAWQSSTRIAQGQTPSFRFTESLKFHEIEPGIEYGQTSAGEASKDERTGPWFINVLRIDLTRATLKVAHALDEGVGLETVSSLATRYGAAAATNGGYFRVNGTYRGECIGLLVLDGKLISDTHNDREEFGLINTGTKTEIVFGHLKFSGQISADSHRRTVEGVNRPVGPDELVLFTPEFHRTALTSPDGIEVVVKSNRVVAIRDLKGSSEIPSDGYVIAAVGKSRDWVKEHVKRNSLMTYSWKLNSIEPGEDKKWRRASTILGGGPQLIKDGKIAITNAQEKIAPAFVNDGHPRTAIAKLASGKLLLITVDGRQASESIGMSLTTLADLLLELGAVDAMNLDGGGSTTMVIHNKLVNKPSDQTGERPVSDAILVFPKPN